jgi:hypothetical protein
MMKETSDTLGNQKKVNYALNQPNEESLFRRCWTVFAPPGYFEMNAAMNKAGYESFDSVLQHGMNPLQQRNLKLKQMLGSNDSGYAGCR